MNEQEPARLGVPVGEAVLAAYRAVLLRPGVVLEFGWLPLLAMLAALLLPGLALRYAPGAAAMEPLVSRIGTFAEAAVALLALNAFAVRWHQLMLLRDPHLLPRRVFAWAWVRFLVYSLVIYAVGGGLAVLIMLSGAASPPASAPATAATLLEAVAAIALAVAAARLSLLLPAAACGMPLGIAAAWRLMRGNTWRLMGASLLAALPLLLVTGLLLGRLFAAVAPSPEGASAPPLGLFLLSGVVEAVLRLLLVGLGASILSDFYRRIMASRQKEGSASR